MRGLHRLDLDIFGITDVGLGALAALEELTELKLARGRLTEEALRFVARLPQLRRLYLLLGGYWFSEAAIARFRAARPDVVVCR